MILANLNFFQSLRVVVYKQINYVVVLTGCKDIDDALHCTSLPNGNFELGVRILESTESHLNMTELSI